MAEYPGQLLGRLRRLVSLPSSGGDTDVALLERFARERDETAFAALLARHGGMVLGVCRRVLRNVQEAEDVAQAVWLVLARKAASIRRPDALAAWLHETARRLALNARRGDSRRRQRETRKSQDSPPPSQPDLLDELSARELLLILDEELPRLPEVYRLPVILCCLEGRSQEEAARQLGWTPGSLRGRLMRGREQLHARLVRRGLELAVVLGALAVAQGMAAAGATVRAAGAFAAGKREPDLRVSANAVTVAEGAMKGMNPGRLKIGLGLVLVLSSLSAAAGALRHRVLAAREFPSGARPIVKAAAFPHPEEKKQTRLDPHGDPLPPGAIARLGSARLRHGGTVFSVALSPDGKTVVSGAQEPTIRCWDATTGKELRRFVGHRGMVLCVSFAPNGKTLASAGSDSTIRLWEAATAREIRQLKGHKGLVGSIAFSRDGRVLASGSSDGTLRLWEAATGKALHKITRGDFGGVRGVPLGVEAVALSPDGRTLTSGSLDGTLRLWETATGKELRTLKGHQGLIRAVAFAADGKVLASGGEGRTVRLWEAATGKELHQLKGHQKGIDALAFSHDGKTLASASWGPTIRLWDPATGKELRQLQGHQQAVKSVAFSADGRTLVSGSYDNTIRLWDVASGKEIRPFPGHAGNVTAVTFAPDGKTLASGSYDQTLRLWRVAGGKELRRLVGHQYIVTCAAFAPDGRTLVSGSYDNTARLWEVATGKELRAFRGHQGTVSSVIFAPDGKLLASADNTIRLWDPASGKEVRRLPSRKGEAYRTAVFSPDGRVLIAGGAAGVIASWEVATGRSLLPFARRQLDIRALALSPDGKLLASGSEDKTIILWEVVTRQPIRRFSGHRDSIRRFSRHRDSIRSLAFSPDGKLLASASGGDVIGTDDTVRLWDVATGAELRRLKGHKGRVYSVAFSPDGRILASGGIDTTTLLWDVPGLMGGVPVRAAPPAEDLKGLWTALGSQDASTAYQAMRALSAAPERSVPLLRQRLRPVVPIDPQRLTRLLANLRNNSFTVREKATTELQKLGDRSESALRKVLQDRPPLEVRRRVERLLEALDPARSPERLRALRALQVLEQIGTPEAREVLKELARGDPTAGLTEEAKACLQRLARRRGLSR